MPKKKKKPGWKTYLEKQSAYEKERKTPTTKKDLERRDFWKKYHGSRIAGAPMVGAAEKHAAQKSYWIKQAEKERFALRRRGVVSVPIQKRRKKKSVSVRFVRDHAGYYRSGS